MPRDVDERKKRKALRKLRKAAELAEAGRGPELSDWERAFLEEVEARIEEFGSAFADPSKGHQDEALSALQLQKLNEIEKKARGKGLGGFGRKPYTKSHKDEGAPENPLDEWCEAEDTSVSSSLPRPTGRPVFKVIEGGKSETD